MEHITDLHRDYKENLSDWEANHDCFKGDTTVKDKGQTYLPKLTADQTDTDYKIYKANGKYNGVVGRTVRGLTGSAMLKAPEINLSGRMEGLITHAKVTDAVQENIKQGRLGMLIDMPLQTDPPKILNTTLKLYTTFNITNWEYSEDGVLIRVVLKEAKHDGAIYYRELLLFNGVYVVNIWEEDANGEWVVVKGIIPKSSSGTLKFIPFIFINANQVSSEVVVSPIQDLTWTTIWHYQKFADYSRGLRLTALPTATATGINEDDAPLIKLGSGTALVSPNPDAKFGMLEYTGQGLGAIVTALEIADKQAIYLGARLLEDQKKGVESEETHRLKQNAENATLSSIVNAVEQGFRIGIEYANIFLGTSVDPETAFSMSKDFVDMKMSPDEITALMNDWQSQGMSYETYYYLKQKGEMTRPGVTAEEERAQIESEAPVMNVL